MASERKLNGNQVLHSSRAYMTWQSTDFSWQIAETLAIRRTQHNKFGNRALRLGYTLDISCKSTVFLFLLEKKDNDVADI